LRIADDLESLADYVDDMVSLRTKYQESLNLDEQYWQEFFSIEEELIKYFFELKVFFSSLDLSDKEHYIKKLDGFRKRTHFLKDQLVAIKMNKNLEKELFLAFTDMYYCLNKIRSHLFKLTEELGLIYEKKKIYFNGAN